jgi:hypothetical protein
MLVMLVSAAKTHFEEQALEFGTKQGRQANKADRLRRQIDKAGRLARQEGWQGRQADKADRLTRQTG